MTDAGAPTVLQLPGCVRDLLAQCPSDGTCVVDQPDAGRSGRACYASGVRATFTYEATGCPGLPDGGENRTIVEVRKPDGTLCYAVEEAVGTFCESRRYTWRNSAGAIVASGSSEQQSFGSQMLITTIACSSSGQFTSISCPISSAACALDRPLGQSCGACPTTPDLLPGIGCTAGTCQ